MSRSPASLRTQLFADPEGRFVHDVVLDSCRRHAAKIAIVDASCIPVQRITYAAYGAMVGSAARGLVASGIRPGEVIGIFLPNCWEFGVAYHAATLAGAVPTTLNPTYREREVRHQLENSEAVALITDGGLLTGIDLGLLPALRRVYTVRAPGPTGSQPFDSLFEAAASVHLPMPEHDSRLALATLPYSSGTTGLPKGVMLSHYNLVSNVYQTLTPGEYCAISEDDVMLCFLPLYHIYGLTVGLNLALIRGCTLVLMPRFDCEASLQLIAAEGVTFALCVPPTLLAYCQAAEQGKFPRDHRMRWVKSGAAPLAPELARRFTASTGIPIRQGYGMTEASPVTHIGFLAPELYKPESVGMPVAQTDCRVVDEKEQDVAPGEIGELVMRGPQFMLGYWKSPDATAAVLRDGWYWTGDIVRVDEDGFYYVVDRRKEMMKYKGFSIAPAEVESVLLEHPMVRDCGVVSRIDVAGEEIPCAFVVVREEKPANQQTAEELQAFVAERLTNYKMPREIYFVQKLPRTASGKILRRELRKLV
ncbi:MAG: class I adenylate-forming enzyme family protein [Candidatus Korobacteraceae bacterium]|jgi:acyl-CoA synthetase (AMP-forming)/AMP-acid ligase II